MGSPSQISRVLKELIDAGKPVPRVSLAELAQETLKKLGVAVQLGSAQTAYAEDKTTKIQMRTTFNTG